MRAKSAISLLSGRSLTATPVEHKVRLIALQLHSGRQQPEGSPPRPRRCRRDASRPVERAGVGSGEAESGKDGCTP